MFYGMFMMIHSLTIMGGWGIRASGQGIRLDCGRRKLVRGMGNYKSLWWEKIKSSGGKWDRSIKQN